MAKIIHDSGYYYISNIDNFVALVELESRYDSIKKLANIDFSISFTELTCT